LRVVVDAGKSVANIPVLLLLLLLMMMMMMMLLRYSWSDEHCSTRPIYTFVSTPFTVKHRVSSLMVSRLTSGFYSYICKKNLPVYKCVRTM